MQCRNDTIAIIDDDVFLRRALERILRARDYRTVEFDSAEDYLQHGQDFGIECLIVDVALPGMTGLELYSRLTQAPAAPAAIFITGFSTPYLQAATRSLGAIDCLAKPFDAVMLLAAIERAAAMPRLRDAVFRICGKR